MLVEKIIELTKEFDQEINYLLQAKQYIPNIPLLTNIQQAIDKLPEVLNNQEDAKIANYKAELKQLRNEYADWYGNWYWSRNWNGYESHERRSSTQCGIEVLIASEINLVEKCCECRGGRENSCPTCEIWSR